MNCQELTQLLDDGDLRNLPQARRAELDVHLSACAECAAEWRVQERIVMTPALSVPAGFVMQCRQLVAAGSWRFRRRVILYSGALVLAAAAALLAWRMGSTPASPVVVAAAPVIVAPLPITAPPAQATVQLVTPQVRPEPEPTPERASSQPAVPSAATFTVAVRPLQTEGDDAEGNAIALRFRNRVMTLLQGVPGLALVDTQSGAGAAPADFEMRMTYTGSASPAPLSRTVNLAIQKPAEFAATEAAVAAEATMNPADQMRSRVTRQRADIEKRGDRLRGGNFGLTLLLGQSPTMAIIDEKISPQPDMVEYSAQKLVRDLRIKVFPLDQSFEQQELVILANPAQKYGQRRGALGALLSYAERRGGFSHASPAVVRAGGEFALNSHSDIDLERPMIWDGLVLTGSPELVPYLIRGLDEVPQTETRLQLVRILAEKYGDDPRARAALAAAAKSNDQPTVRMAAMRESGGSQWSEYVVATLRNPTLPDVQRLQPIADMAPGDLGTLSTSPKTKFALDDSQLRELETLVIRAAPDSTANETVKKALFAAGAMDTPVARDMLIEILHAIHEEDVPADRQRLSIMSVRGTVRSLIAYRYAGDPKARAVIAEIASSSNQLEAMEAQMQLSSMDMKASIQKFRQDQQPTQQPTQPPVQ